MKLKILRPGLLLAAALVSTLFAGVAHAADCEPRLVYSANATPALATEVQPVPITHEFDSGARWDFCLSFDTHSGLVLGNLAYGAPAEPLRRVLNEATLGQILFKYDEDIDASHVLSEHAIGAGNLMQTDPGFCDSGSWLSVPGPANTGNVCQRQRDINNLTQVRNETPLRRRELSLHSWARVGTLIYQSIWRLSEDGEITPGLHLQGRLARYTDDVRYGSPINGRERLASHATVVANWRLDFDIGGNNANDRIEEIEFPGVMFEALSRPINRLPLTTESLRQVDRDVFRGWLISDSEISSAVNGITRIGYYLDPQTSGYAYRSRRYNWPNYDLVVTRDNPCERLASFNTGRAGGCGISLDFYTNGESITDGDFVVWFSLARHLAPRSEDYPAIGSLAAEFKMIPYDWSAYTPFSPPVDEP